MTPYYDDGTVTIYHGDCLEVLDELCEISIDAVVTDPPYGNGTDYPSFDDSPLNVSLLIADVLPKVRAMAPVTLVTPGIGRLRDYPAPTWTLAWFAPGGTGSGPWGFTTWQPVLAYGACPYLARGLGRRPDGFVAQFRTGKRHNEPVDHPCAKPLRTMKWLVERATPVERMTVLDPLMGSGTTLRAAKDLGRKAIGIEIEERYCEIAAKRMAQEVLPL